MSKLDAGNVTITLNGTDRTLRPTLDAITRISTQFGGLAKARDALVSQDFAATVFVISAGLNTAPKQVKALQDDVFANGLSAELIVPLINYVAILANGGRPLTEETETSGEGAEGNAL